jgi:bifunctional DNA-binding transcriptional regulator/antitoxin component of YhaV-PrlF toxin-antitoxin module
MKGVYKSHDARNYIMQTQTIRLSSNGHIVIPKAILDAYHFNIGQELEIETTSQGILLNDYHTIET